MLDDRAFQRSVDSIESLGITTIASCHSPSIGRAQVGRAFEQFRRFASVSVPPQPDQAVLDQIIAALSAAAA